MIIQRVVLEIYDSSYLELSMIRGPYMLYSRNVCWFLTDVLKKIQVIEVTRPDLETLFFGRCSRSNRPENNILNHLKLLHNRYILKVKALNFGFGKSRLFIHCPKSALKRALMQETCTGKIWGDFREYSFQKYRESKQNKEIWSLIKSYSNTR